MKRNMRRSSLRETDPLVQATQEPPLLQRPPSPDTAQRLLKLRLVEQHLRCLLQAVLLLLPPLLCHHQRGSNPSTRPKLLRLVTRHLRCLLQAMCLSLLLLLCHHRKGSSPTTRPDLLQCQYLHRHRSCHLHEHKHNHPVLHTLMSEREIDQPILLPELHLHKYRQRYRLHQSCPSLPSRRVMHRQQVGPVDNLSLTWYHLRTGGSGIPLKGGEELLLWPGEWAERS